MWYDCHQCWPPSPLICISGIFWRFLFLPLGSISWRKILRILIRAVCLPYNCYHEFFVLTIIKRYDRPSFNENWILDACHISTINVILSKKYLPLRVWNLQAPSLLPFSRFPRCIFFIDSTIHRGFPISRSIFDCWGKEETTLTKAENGGRIASLDLSLNDSIINRQIYLGVARNDSLLWTPARPTTSLRVFLMIESEISTCGSGVLCQCAMFREGCAVVWQK